MKRALALALGAMMAAGSAAPAAAASHIDFSGYYRAYYGLDSNLGRQNGDAAFTDDYFGHRLNLDITFTPTDEIAVYWRLRGPDFQRWGQPGNSAGVVTRHIYGEIKQDWGTVYVGRLHEDFDGWGLANLGYVGGFDPIFMALAPFDDAGNVDGIRYVKAWDNGFQLMAQYSKMEANDHTGGVVNAPVDFFDDDWSAWDSDRDYDRIEVEGAYMWENGGASLGVRYERDAFNADQLKSITAFSPPSISMVGNGTYNAWFLNPAIMHSWGDFSVHFEGKFGWGTQETATFTSPGLTLSVEDTDLSGYALYMDMDYNYGPGNVTLAAWWVSGTELNDYATTAYPDNKSLVDMGGTFIPLVVAYGDNAGLYGRVGSYEGSANAINLANNGGWNFIVPGLFDLATGTTMPFLAGSDAAVNLHDNNSALNPEGATTSARPFDLIELNSPFREDSSHNYGGAANHWGVTLAGNHAFTDDISMHYAVGYLALNNPNYRAVNSMTVVGAGAASDFTDIAVTPVSYIEQDKDLGVELDLGFTFQLLDNLTYTTMFGYMFTGDAFKQLKGYTYTETAAGTPGNGDAEGRMNAVWANGKDAYVWQNTLQFDF